MNTLNQIEEALQFISPDMERDEWVRIGMSIKSELGDSGFELFDTWSQAGGNYRAADTRATWRSINGSGGITVGTLFHLAIENGYKPQQQALTPEEQARLAKEAQQRAEQRKKAEAKAEVEKLAKQQASARLAVKQWDKAGTADPLHPYVTRKKITPYGARQSDNILLIPMYHRGELVNLQRIYLDGAKRFLKDARVTGCYMPLGDLSDHIRICEGYATGCSLHEHTGAPVAVAFNAGNLKSVALSIRKKYPSIKISVAADNDTCTPGNPGLTKGRAAAAAVGGNVIWPDFSDEDFGGSDFNDFLTQGGEL